MKSFYTPDTRWDFYQISDEEEFAEKLVIEGVFHQEVPEDVIEAYETTEYLMAHSYYYWPMYDEAFHKVLLIIEMGIKLKAKQLDIPLFRRKKNGERWERQLSKIINDVCKEDYLGELKQKLDRSRGLRNMQAHPKQNSFSGPMGGIIRNIKYCINVLNLLFRNKEWHIKQHKRIEAFRQTLSHFKNHLLVIENDKGANLVSSILDFNIIDNVLFVSCLPVLDFRKLKEDNQGDILPNASIYKIKDYRLLNHCIEGNTQDGAKIRISVTDHDEAIEAFKNQQEYLDNIPDDKKRAYVYLNAQESGWQLSEAEYQYFKNVYSKIV